MTQKIPRQPTEAEKKQLVDFLFDERPFNADEEEVRNEIETRVADAYIAVFDEVYNRKCWVCRKAHGCCV
jgi:hypothetical protein